MVLTLVPRSSIAGPSLVQLVHYSICSCHQMESRIREAEKPLIGNTALVNELCRRYLVAHYFPDHIESNMPARKHTCVFMEGSCCIALIAESAQFLSICPIKAYGHHRK